MAHYIAAIHKEAQSDFGVSFPDFPGCISAGQSLQDAMNMGREALNLHIEGMREDSLELPSPKSLDEVESDPDFKDAVFFVIDVETDDPVVRVNITLRESVLKKIDDIAEAAGKKRSQFLAEAGLAYRERS